MHASHCLPPSPTSSHLSTPLGTPLHSSSPVHLSPLLHPSLPLCHLQLPPPPQLTRRPKHIHLSSPYQLQLLTVTTPHNPDHSSTSSPQPPPHHPQPIHLHPPPLHLIVVLSPTHHPHSMHLPPAPAPQQPTSSPTPITSTSPTPPLILTTPSSTALPTRSTRSHSLRHAASASMVSSSCSSSRRLQTITRNRLLSMSRRLIRRASPQRSEKGKGKA